MDTHLNFMMALTKDKRAPVKDNLLYVRFGSTDIHTVNTPPNIQAQGLHIAWKGTTAPTIMTGQDNA
jgi:hypothetical protein